MPLNRIYPITIRRSFVAGDLRMPSAAELERGEEEGLGGNQHYQDLRGLSWDQVAEVVEEEAALIARFEAAGDLDAEAEEFQDERLDGDDALWGLDVGVAGATFALSALGAFPIGSCNAGGFGGHHVASFPYVAFFAEPAIAPLILSIAESAEVGLDVVDGGTGRLFGRTDHDLHRFARVALSRMRGGHV
jgi:hypothetical protein